MEQSHHSNIKINVCMCVHIHNVFASNELISVTILLLCTDSPFRLSLLIFLSGRKRTFSQTIMTLSVSILHIPFPFLHSLVQFPFYIHQMPSYQISLLAIHTIQSSSISRAQYSKCDFSQNHTKNVSGTFPNVSNKNGAFR